MVRIPDFEIQPSHPKFPQLFGHAAQVKAAIARWTGLSPIQREMEWQRVRGCLLEQADDEERAGKGGLARAIRRMAR